MTARDLVLIAEAREAVASGRAATLRKEARLSQSEFARAIDVSSAAVCRWEAGKRQPQGKPAVRLALLLRRLAAREATPA